MLNFRNFMNLDKVNLATFKWFLTVTTAVTLGTLFVRSCHKVVKTMNNTPFIDPKIQEDQKMTLIDKENDKEGNTLFFDTDGQQNTTEVIAHNTPCCWTQKVRIHDAKIGTTQSFQDWKKDLFCENCGKKIFWSVEKVRDE